MGKPYCVKNIKLVKSVEDSSEGTYWLELCLNSVTDDKHLVEIALTNIDVISKETILTKTIYSSSHNSTHYKYKISKETYDVMSRGDFELHCTLREHLTLQQYRDYQEKFHLYNGLFYP